MQGLGNDYVYIDAITQEIKDPSKLSKFVSNRNFGIGSDGLIILLKSEKADFKMRMFNSDGGEAEMCGNGIRCLAKFIYDKKFINKDKFTIETLAGIKYIFLNIEDNKVISVKVDMGTPILDPKNIPVVYTLPPNETSVKNLILTANNKDFKFTCVSMGNPHAVTIVDNVKEFDVHYYGKIFECHECFPKKCNIEFIEIIDKQNIKMRVWERGSGETLACGTGACATCVACVLNGFCDRKCNVELLGGILNIEWNIENNHVYMTGPAVTVFEGELYYN